MIPVYVLNLARAVDRRERMKARLDQLGIPFAFFPAIDGKMLSAKEIAELDARPQPLEYGHLPVSGELATVASFRKFLYHFADSPHQFAMLCEDDVILEKDAVAFLDEYWLRKLPRFDILRLGLTPNHLKGMMRPVARLNRIRICIPMQPGNNGNASIFNRDSARAIADSLVPMRAPIDNMLFRDGYFPRRIFQAMPSIARPDETGSCVARVSPEEAGIKKTPAKIAARYAFVLNRKLRCFSNFIVTWGWTSILYLRPSRSLVGH